MSQKNPQPKINKGYVAYPDHPDLQNSKTPQRYIKVSDASEISLFVQSSRWSECIACKCINGHYCSPNTWMIPEDLYNLLINNPNK